jgi:hypothetical protein
MMVNEAPQVLEMFADDLGLLLGRLFCQHSDACGLDAVEELLHGPPIAAASSD